MTLTVGFIGLGAMGAPMARRLAATGLQTRGFDPFAPDPGEGVIRAGSAAEAAHGADAVVLMVATADQALQALQGESGVLAGLRAGAVVIVTATIGPEAAESLAARIAEAGGRMVDAPVSGGVVRAATGELLIMASGAADDVASVQSVLDALGAKVFTVGSEIGDGQRMKLVNQLLCGVHVAVASEALAYAKALGIDPAAAFGVVSTGAAASFMLDDRDRIVEEAFEQPKSAVDIFVKDLGLVTAATDMELPIAQSALSRFQAASAAGKGRFDDSALVTTYPSYDTPMEEKP